MHVDPRDELEDARFEEDLHFQQRLYGVFSREEVVGRQQREEVLLGERLLDMVADGVDRLPEVVVEIEERVQHVDVVEVGLHSVLKQQAGAELELPSVLEPQELLEVVVIEDIDKELLEVGLDGLSVVIQEHDEQFGVIFSVLVELVEYFIVLYIKIQTLFVVVLEVLDQEPGLSDFEGAEFEEVLADGYVLDVFCHFLFVLGAVVDEGVEEEQAVLEQLQEELVASGGGLDVDEEVLVVLEDVHDLLFRVDVVEDDLPLEVYLGLQAGQGVEGRPAFLPEAVDEGLEDGADAVDEVEDDRVVLEVDGLVVAVEPHLAGLGQQPDLAIVLDEFGEFLLLLPLSHEDDGLQFLDEVAFGVDLIGDEPDRCVVDVVGIVVVEEQQE